MEENLYCKDRSDCSYACPVRRKPKGVLHDRDGEINYHTIGVSPTLQGRLFEAPSIGALPWWCKFRPKEGAGGLSPRLPWGIRRGVGTHPPRWGLGQRPIPTAIEMLWSLG